MSNQQPQPESFNEFRRLSIKDTLHASSMYHLTDAIRPLRDKICSICPEATLSDNLISLAPVKFDRHWFDINEEARAFALVVAVKNEDGDVVDVAAFELGHPFRVKRLIGLGIALGLSEIFEARHHPQFRVPCHSNIWAYLKSGCTGLLPIHWRHTVLHLHERGVGGVVASTIEEGQAIARLMSEALPPIPVYVQTTQEAA